MIASIFHRSVCALIALSLLLVLNAQSCGVVIGVQFPVANKMSEMSSPHGICKVCEKRPVQQGGCALFNCLMIVPSSDGIDARLIVRDTFFLGRTNRLFAFDALPVSPPI